MNVKHYTIVFIPDNFDISKYYHFVKDEMEWMVYSEGKTHTVLTSIEDVKTTISSGMYCLVYGSVLDDSLLCFDIIYTILKQLDLIIFEQDIDGGAYTKSIINVNIRQIKEGIKTISSGGWGLKYGGWGCESKI